MASSVGRSILDFSISPSPDSRSVMAILTAYADESGKATDGASRCISFAALIGTVEQWRKFDRSWRRMLARHKIPWLHMNKLIEGLKTGEGPFAKFKDANELSKLLSDAVAAIIGPPLFCCANAVWLDDLRAALKAHNISADPYSFTLYVAVVNLGTEALNSYPDEPAFHLILDRLEKGTKRTAEAEELYETDRFNAWRGWPAVTPLKPKDEKGSNDMPELQAADFAAWLMKRYLEYTEQWMRQIKPTLGANEIAAFDDSLDEWLQARVAEERSPISAQFLRARRMLQRRLKFFPYDRERLENQIFAHRKHYCDRILKARTIARAGPNPLTP